MRRTTLVLSALLAVLALSVGALAYPAVVGSHIPPGIGSSTTSPKASHPTTVDDNGTTNETAPPSSPSPAANETENETAPPVPSENETGNASETTNVTETHNGNTTWVNGTIDVWVANDTVVNMTFSVVAVDGMGANVTFSGSFDVNGTAVSVSGTAALVLDAHSAYIHATYTVTRDGMTLASRDLAFQMIWDGTSTVIASPLEGLRVGLTLTHY